MYTAKLLNSDDGLTNTFHHEYSDTLKKVVRNKFYTIWQDCRMCEKYCSCQVYH